MATAKDPPVPPRRPEVGGGLPLSDTNMTAPAGALPAVVSPIPGRPTPAMPAQPTALVAYDVCRPSNAMVISQFGLLDMALRGLLAGSTLQGLRAFGLPEHIIMAASQTRGLDQLHNTLWALVDSSVRGLPASQRVMHVGSTPVQPTAMQGQPAPGSTQSHEDNAVGRASVTPDGSETQTLLVNIEGNTGVAGGSARPPQTGLPCGTTPVLPHGRKEEAGPSNGIPQAEGTVTVQASAVGTHHNSSGTIKTQGAKRSREEEELPMAKRLKHTESSPVLPGNHAD